MMGSPEMSQVVKVETPPLTIVRATVKAFNVGRKNVSVGLSPFHLDSRRLLSAGYGSRLVVEAPNSPTPLHLSVRPLPLVSLRKNYQTPNPCLRRTLKMPP
jgi:hypothetical protein